MTTRLTLWLDGDRVALLGQRDRAPIDERLLDRRVADAPLADWLAQLMISARTGRTEAVIVLGYPDAHVREVPSLPFAADAEDVRAALEIGQSRFLRTRSDGAVVLGIWKGIHSWIVADCDRATLDAVIVAGARAGVRIRAIVPEVSVRAAGADAGDLEWIAAGASVSVRAERRTAVAVRTTLVIAPSTDQRRFEVESGSVDHLPGCFEPAAAARTARKRRLRRGLLVAAVCAGVVFGTLAPGLGAVWLTLQAERELSHLSRTQTFSVDSLEVLASYRARADAIATFNQSGRAASTDIGVLAGALPTGSAILSLHADSTTIRLVVLAPEASNLLPGIVLDSQWSEITLLGPIIKEPIEGRVLERIAFEMRIREAVDVPTP